MTWTCSFGIQVSTYVERQTYESFVLKIEEDSPRYSICSLTFCAHAGMTEKSNPEHIDIFYRQALLGGNRVPVIWGGPFELLKMLHEEADVDVGQWGLATDGIMEVESAEQATEVPWAARYMKCKDEVQDLCKNEPRFCSTCWIDREDGIKPEQAQLDRPRGQVSWHPGWRSHQLTGRNIAFAVLEALQAAVNVWNEGVMGKIWISIFVSLVETAFFLIQCNDDSLFPCFQGGPPLDDAFWHVTDYYENIRNKVLNLDKGLGSCYKNEGFLPTRVCTTPMKVRILSSWRLIAMFPLLHRTVFIVSPLSGKNTIYTSSKLRGNGTLKYCQTSTRWLCTQERKGTIVRRSGRT